MKIGYGVEGSTDRAFITGLQKKLYPYAKLIEGRSRGSTGESLRREIESICYELTYKGADVIVFLTDANESRWHEVKRREINRVPEDRKHRTIYGVAERNIECWITADEEYTRRIGINPDAIRKVDPKPEFERVIGITGIDKKENEIAQIVEAAPLEQWRLSSKSFEDFYDQIQGVSKLFGCRTRGV